MTKKTSARWGDTVSITGTRPRSKDKRWAVLSILEKA